MLRRFKTEAILTVLFLLVFGYTQISLAEETITGVVLESGFSGVVVQAGGKTGKYNTGKETTFSPEEYRPVKGDTITLTFYPKTLRTGGDVLAISSLTLVSKDPNRKELTSPARGTIQEVGKKSIRVDFPEAAQNVSMDLKRDMETVPAGWQPEVGAKVTVYFDKVKSRFANTFVFVISKLEKGN
jgi:hypothetical protein